MVDLSSLRDSIAGVYGDVRQVDEWVLQFTRRADNVPFAVCYLDAAPSLPKTRQALTEYQDRIIGAHYFSGPKSLQWNNYLYFVVSPTELERSEVRRARQIIEADRRYARKFVISESELDSVIRPAVAFSASGAPTAAVLDAWLRILAQAEIDDAVLSDDELPKRLRIIERTTKRRDQPITASRSLTATGAEPFLRSLRLDDYRPFPTPREFDFGAVNLISGANGAGKTSLLEAIELFYCGRNYRDPKGTQPYKLTGLLGNGETRVVDHNQPLQTFRDRNLTWYGQAEVKTNDLYRRFAQFNFLNSDAAVGLAESATRIEDDLSQLLVGPEAAKIWADINRVLEGVQSKIRDLLPTKEACEKELSFLENYLDPASLTPESRVVRSQFEQLVNRFGWSTKSLNDESVLSTFIDAVVEFVPRARQATGLEWAPERVSFDSLGIFCRTNRALCESAGNTLRDVTTQENQIERYVDEASRCREALVALQDLELVLGSGVSTLVRERNQQRTVVARHAGLLAGLEHVAASTIPDLELDTNLDECLGRASEDRLSAQDSLAAKQRDSADLEELRRQSTDLAEQLRAVADRILDHAVDQDVCPLCYTSFAPGQLRARMHGDVSDPAAAVSEALRTEVRRLTSVVGAAARLEGALATLARFRDRAGMGADATVRDVLSHLESVRATIANAQRRLQAVEQELRSLADDGYSQAVIDARVARLTSLGFKLGSISVRAVTDARSEIEELLRAATEHARTLREMTIVTRKALQVELGASEATTSTLLQVLASLRERVSTAESLLIRLEEIWEAVQWGRDTPFVELLFQAESVRDAATRLQSAIAEERIRRKAVADARERRDALQEQLLEIDRKRDRFANAASALGRIVKHHSLKSAMNAALRENRSAIEAIFTRIHAPREFSGLGTTLGTLVRRGTGREVSLREISTGQRAAFALSIFMAQNAQLTVAPPVIIIDDPIAHIDDLNALSFLDYLREVVLAGRRQVFFATSDSTLAALFARKFEFLGSQQFRVFELTRETPNGQVGHESLSASVR
jgi:energy-coupling factor transporter ATP-binding protein EcfA2